MNLHPIAAASLGLALLSGTAYAQTPTMPSTVPGVMSNATTVAAASAMEEARALLDQEVKETGRKSYSPESAVKFKASDNVFVRSVLDIDFTKGKASVTLPLFRGVSPKGEPVYYIITDASDADVARQMGLNFAPKLRHAIGSPGVQMVTFHDGVITFRGDIDFSPKRAVMAGSPMPFPPAVAKPGALADLKWSSLVVLPSGVVLDVQMVHNATGNQDRVLSIDLKKQTVTLSIVDGYQGGKEYFYHLVTEASDPLPATLEKGVYSPSLGLIPATGMSDRPRTPPSSAFPRC